MSTAQDTVHSQQIANECAHAPHAGDSLNIEALARARENQWFAEHECEMMEAARRRQRCKPEECACKGKCTSCGCKGKESKRSA